MKKLISLIIVCALCLGAFSLAACSNSPQEAKLDPENMPVHVSDDKYRNYYHFRKDDGSKTPPNNWTSFFSGPAWNYYEKEELWALHLFSKKQMDLNWDNEKLRANLIEMINWWLAKGVDGFRMDVINYISKEEGLPDGDETIGSMMGYPGIEHYYYGPNLHKYLHSNSKPDQRRRMSNCLDILFLLFHHGRNNNPHILRLDPAKLSGTIRVHQRYG